MTSPYSYFAYFGTLYLIKLTYQDYKNNKIIDDRNNWFMMGIAISLLSHVSLNILYLLALIFISPLLYLILRKNKAFGEGDKNTLIWIFIGLGILDPIAVLTFFVIFFSVTFLFLIVKKILIKLLKQNDRPLQFYAVILISFIVCMISLKLY